MTPLSRLRRYTWWSVAAGGMAVGFGTALDLVTHDYGLVKSLSVALAVALVIVQHTRYMRQAMSGLGRGEHRPWEHAATFAVALAAWAVMAGSGAFLPAWALLPALVVAHVGAVLPARSRWPVVAVMSALTIATGGVFGGTHARPAMVLAVAMIVALVFADLIQLWIWQLVLRQEQGRKTAEALAVAEERLRFAADLHDIQGHHLQAIALKGELAQRLIGRDDDLARQHAGEVAELAGRRCGRPVRWCRATDVPAWARRSRTRWACCARRASRRRSRVTRWACRRRCSRCSARWCGRGRRTCCDTAGRGAATW